LSYEERKQKDKNIRKTQNKIAKLEKLIAELETKVEEMNQQLLDPSAYNEELMDGYNLIKKDLEKAMSDWEDGEQELEQLIA